MGGISIKLSGAPEAIARLKGYSRAVVDKASMAGVYAIGSAVIKAALPLTPKRFGTLRASGYCTVPTVHDGKTTCTVGFGGAAKAYAEAQHQGFIERNGKKIVFANYTEPGTGPLFLDNAAKQIQARATQLFIAAFKAVIAGSTKTFGQDAPTTPPSGGGAHGGSSKGARSRQKRRRNK